MRSMRLACAATTMMILCGCQQVAWKPGAGAADLDRDMAACAADHAERAAQQDCLRKRGWVVRVPKPSGEAVAPDEVESAPTTVAAGAGVMTATTSPTTPAGEPAAGIAAAPRHKSVPPDPLKRMHIQAWWKMGGQPDALNADIDACVGQLGPEHAPDFERRLYTRGSIECLKARGWWGR